MTTYFLKTNHVYDSVVRSVLGGIVLIVTHLLCMQKSGERYPVPPPYKLEIVYLSSQQKFYTFSSFKMSDKSRKAHKSLASGLRGKRLILV